MASLDRGVKDEPYSSPSYPPEDILNMHYQASPSFDAREVSAAAVEQIFSPKAEEDEARLQPGITQREPTTFGTKNRADVRIIVGEGDDTRHFDLNSGVLACTSEEWNTILPHPSMHGSSSEGTCDKFSIVLPAINPSAMKIILHSCHFEYEEVPRQVSTQLLYDVASSLSSFQMSPVLGKSASVWISDIRNSVGVPDTNDAGPEVLSKAGKKRKHTEFRENSESGSHSTGTQDRSSSTKAQSSTIDIDETNSESTAAEPGASSPRKATIISEGTRGQVSNIASAVPDSDRVLLISWELGDPELFLCSVRTLVNDSFVSPQGDVVGPSNVVLTNHMYNARMMGMVDRIIQIRADIVTMAFKSLSNMQERLLNASSCLKPDANPESKEYCATVILGGFRRFLHRNPLLNCLEDPGKYKGTVRDLISGLRQNGAIRRRSRHADCNIFADVVDEIENFHMDAMRDLQLSEEQLKHMSLR